MPPRPSSRRRLRSRGRPAPSSRRCLQRSVHSSSSEPTLTHLSSNEKQRGLFVAVLLASHGVLVLVVALLLVRLVLLDALAGADLQRCALLHRLLAVLRLEFDPREVALRAHVFGVDEQSLLAAF